MDLKGVRLEMSESKGLSRKGVLIDFLNNVDVERQKNHKSE